MKIKKCLAVLLASAITLSACIMPWGVGRELSLNEITASAATNKPTSGACGENVTWVLDSNGLLTISGKGNMNESNFFANRDDIKSVVIKDGVTSIGERDFYKCTSLTEIIIPDSVTKIGIAAFQYCTSLKDITIPDSITSIGDSAFSNTLWLKSKQKENPLVIVNNIIIDGRTCEGNVVIPDSVTSICAYAFYGCISLTNVTISDSVTSIFDYAFYGCISLTSITIPDSVTSIGENAFGHCTSLTDIKIPDSITIISIGAFSYCESLTEITIPDSVTSIKGYAFYNCKPLKNVTIPESVTSINNNAFGECSLLNSITILNSKCEIDYHGSTICNGNKNGDYFNGTIYGYPNSTAQAYAEKYSYKFEALPDDYVPPTTQPTTTPATTTTATTTIHPDTEKSDISNDFVWGRDNWNFNNSTDYFTRGTYYMDQKYIDRLSMNISEFNMDYVRRTLDTDWKGSGHGMCVLAMLAKCGYLPYSEYTSDAKCLIR